MTLQIYLIMKLYHKLYHKASRYDPDTRLCGGFEAHYMSIYPAIEKKSSVAMQSMPKK